MDDYARVLLVVLVVVVVGVDSGGQVLVSGVGMVVGKIVGKVGGGIVVRESVPKVLWVVDKWMVVVVVVDIVGLVVVVKMLNLFLSCY